MCMYDFSIEDHHDDGIVMFVSNYGEEVTISVSIDQLPAIVKCLNYIIEDNYV